MKTPDEIRAAFEQWADARKNNASNEPVSLDDCIWFLLDDVMDSIRRVPGHERTAYEVEDYLSHAYGD